MQTRTISLIAMCAALAACNSKSSEPTEAPTIAATPTIAVPPVSVIATKPAPDGLPSRVAREIITAGKQACSGVTKAERDSKDGTIVAVCASGESYHIYTAEGQGPIAVKQ